MTDSDSLVGVQLGQYQIIDRLGKGGMATVYKALQVSINRTVAIKVLPRSLLHDDTFMKRFRREAEVVAGLEHFHILPIYDYGEYEGMPYIVMRYLEGGTLQDRIKQGPLQWDHIARITSQVAGALDYAHARNVIHRDIKPSNIMLDGDGNAYLADFGIARMTEGTSQLTGSGIVGTPAYMAPEQSEPGAPTPLMDVYALGITLFEMITGHVPYFADTPIAQILMHIQSPIPSLLDYNPDFPYEVDGVVRKALAKSPGERFKSAGELAWALENAIVASGGWEWSPESLAKPGQRAPSPPSSPYAPTADIAPPGAVPTMPRSTRKRTATRPRRKGIGLLLGGGAILLLLAGVAAFWFGVLGGQLPSERALATQLAQTQLAALPTNLPSPALTATSEVPPTATPEPPTSLPTATTEPSPTPSSTTLPTTTTLRGVTMLLVPAGPFRMGSAAGYPRERPEHDVYLDAYYIDQTEVTNLYYMACVDAGSCSPPEFVNSPSQIAYYGSDYYYDYPVIYISWHEAQTYCQWRGGHLPLEAQWEKAARWNSETGESQQFPWLPPVLDPYYLNYGSLLGHTMKVGSYSDGKSPVGALDMAGNVAEWVYDWYLDNYYELSPKENPPGPDSGEYRVIRGGSYESQGSGVTTTYRDYTGPATKLATVGFRCAWTPSGDPTRP